MMMMGRRTVAAVLLLTLVLFGSTTVLAGKGVFQATDSNFKGAVLTGGKNAFVKFLAPWWGHCKSMKGDWDKLGAKHASSEAVMIVDADCTADAKGICGSQGVKGYPTIKYYIDGKASDYQGGRDYAALDKFVSSTLDKAMCDAMTGKGCKPIQQKFIESIKDKSADELKTDLDERTATFKEQSKAFAVAQKEFKRAEHKNKMAVDILKKRLKAGAGKNKKEL